MHFQEQAWRLTRDAQSPEATDADFVDAHVLKGVLDIQDARNNPRLKHLPEPSRPELGWSSRAAAHPDRVLVLLHHSLSSCGSPYRWSLYGMLESSQHGIRERFTGTIGTRKSA